MQKVDLYQPIVASNGGYPPLVIRVGVPHQNSMSEGVPSGGLRSEPYVLLSALPEELRRRVELACQALVSGRLDQMKRQRIATRHINLKDDGTYVDRTVIGVIGGGKPVQIINEFVHGVYTCIGKISSEEINGVDHPRHDKIFIDPKDWTHHFLEKARP